MRTVANNLSRSGEATHFRGRSKPRRLAEDNCSVHGLWIGRHLSNLELLTIHSFIHHGHTFHLWLYEDLDTSLPKEVVLHDAETVLPRSGGAANGANGASRKDLSGFADLFCYKLLYEKGGWWTHMDVTCLRPLDFRSAYLFRANGKGIATSIIKCPPRSELMKLTYEQEERALHEGVRRPAPRRILSQNVRRLKLGRYVRPEIPYEDEWENAIQSFISGDRAPPADWFAVHWVNAASRERVTGNGRQQGKRRIDRTPDKADVATRTALGRFYERYRLNDSGSAALATDPPTALASQADVSAPILKLSARQPIAPTFADELHLNVLIKSLIRGGAERGVLETLQGLAERGSTANLFVLNEAEPSYELPDLGRTRVHRLDGLDPAAKMCAIALEVIVSPTRVLFTHLVKAHLVRSLWNFGITTIPVVHNSRPSWQDVPVAFDNTLVPFVGAVSDSVARQLREQGCPRRVITVRHESQRWFSPEELAASRRETRLRHAISEDTLLIGMVGEFKSQKAYPRAVRVLAEIRRHRPAKLMILGGWDHAWGNGRATYAATCRQALELGVMPDLLTLGSVREVDRYYPAFDVFLNTSIYEGMSVAMLEAARAACPIVSADAGGNREGLPPDAVIVENTADIAAYVAGIETVLTRPRRAVPVRPDDADLVPRLMGLLGQYGCGQQSGRGTKRGVTLFLTENLNLGGAPRSLINLVVRLPPELRPWVIVLNEVNHQSYFDQLDQAGVPVFSLRTAASYLDRVERILQSIQRLGAHTVVFWNLNARTKLLIAKILPREDVRLIDVSPGPFLFQDLRNTAGFQQRIAFGRANYFDRIDNFVVKYTGGVAPDLALPPGKLAIIPNGVPDLSSAPATATPAEFPHGLDPELVLGTSGRLLPNRRLEFLIDMMAELNRRLPGASLIVIGASDSRYTSYFPALQERARANGVLNIHYVGQQQDVASFLRRLRVFVMMTRGHGCPNSSLEAMSVGLPIVANPDGGVVEQIQHGINGFLVSDRDPKDMAHRVRMLLTNPEMRARFGAASRAIACEKFAMETMVESYVRLLDPSRGHPHPAAPCTPINENGTSAERQTAYLHRIIVALPHNRDYAGTLHVESENGEIVSGPFDVCGRADDSAARRNGNPSRDPLLPFGDPPLGRYRIEGVLPGGDGTERPADRFGPHGVIVLKPISGDAALADANGRFHLLIEGGSSAPGWRLRPTNGSLRLTNREQKQLIDIITHCGTTVCDLVPMPDRASNRRIAASEGDPLTVPRHKPTDTNGGGGQ